VDSPGRDPAQLRNARVKVTGSLVLVALVVAAVVLALLG
jgi:hypothetical protein